MNKYILWIFLVPIIFFLPVKTQAEGQEGYRAEIIIDELDYRHNIATAHVVIEATIPAGTGFIYIPLPFVLNTDGRFLVETEEIGYVVLFGDLLPASRYSVIQISQTDSTNTITFTLSKVHVQLGDSSLAQANKVIFLLFRDAEERVREKFGNIATLQSKEVIIVSSDIQSCTPPSRVSGNNSILTIDLTNFNSPVDVKCFLAERQNQILRLILPFIFGFPLGLLGGMQFIRSKLWAKRILFVASITLLIIIIVSVTFYSQLIVLLDNDLLLAFSTLIGTLFGLIIISTITMRAPKELPAS